MPNGKCVLRATSCRLSMRLEESATVLRCGGMYDGCCGSEEQCSMLPKVSDDDAFCAAVAGGSTGGVATGIATVGAGEIAAIAG